MDDHQVIYVETIFKTYANYVGPPIEGINRDALDFSRGHVIYQEREIHEEINEIEVEEDLNLDEEGLRNLDNMMEG